jgi:two-component system NtrC family sensor kinase
VVQLVAHRAADLGVAVEILEGGAQLRVALSADALRQVVLNLVLNALDVTPGGGSVRLCLEPVGEAAELRVEDEGPGVPEALRERVFEPFFSSKPEAPGGLGLAISRRIVEEAGGRIAAEATASGGGCFRVRLPRA